jgi:hypothetical protein
MKGNRIDSQLKAIEKDLKAGKKISPLQALKDYGCLRLSARIWELRNKKHLNIEAKIVDVQAYRFAQYKLVK